MVVEHFEISPRCCEIINLKPGADVKNNFLCNIDTMCFNISEVLAPVQNEHMHFEIASHLMLFMQYRSTHLLPYYAKALADDFANLEDNYYPLFCLSRRLKGHDELQNLLLEKLKLGAVLDN